MGEPVTSADVRFTNAANPSDDVSATSVIIKPTGQGTGPYAQYSVDAVVTFPETGIYGVTVVVNGRFEVENPHRESVIVYDAPMGRQPGQLLGPRRRRLPRPHRHVLRPQPVRQPGLLHRQLGQHRIEIPAEFVGGGGFYTVIGTVDYSRTTRPGTSSLYVRVWDVGPGPNPKGGADISDAVTIVGAETPSYSTSVWAGSSKRMPRTPPTRRWSSSTQRRRTSPASARWA